MCDKDISLATPMDILETSIREEQNIDELNNIIDIFNINMKKKDIIRSSKLSEIQDKIVQQMYDRVDKRADDFSNSDLIQMHKVVNDTLAKSDNTLDNVKVPTIQVNQQINVNGQEFDRESRQRILDTVNSILNSVKDEAIELGEEEVEIISDGFIETE